MPFEQQVDVINERDYGFLSVSSTVFDRHELIPDDYTCFGKNINPPLDIDLIPHTAKSLAVVMDEPDAPFGSFCHWVVWNLPLSTHIKEGENRGTTGMNDFNMHNYKGPCPEEGVHRYFFRIYALNTRLSIPASCNRMQFDAAMRPHIVGYGLLVGRYKV